MARDEVRNVNRSAWSRAKWPVVIVLAVIIIVSWIIIAVVLSTPYNPVG